MGGDLFREDLIGSCSVTLRGEALALPGWPNDVAKSLRLSEPQISFPKGGLMTAPHGLFCLWNKISNVSQRAPKAPRTLTPLSSNALQPLC